MVGGFVVGQLNSLDAQEECDGEDDTDDTARDDDDNGRGVHVGGHDCV